MVRPTVWIGEESLTRLANEADRSVPLETGGVLVGYWLSDRATSVITAVIGPGSEARHTAQGFEPDYGFHVEEVARHYRRSGRLHVYLGDWHTHPDGQPRMSSVDKLTLRRISQESLARAPEPLMGVLSGGPRWSFSLWVLRRCVSMAPWPTCPQRTRLRLYKEGVRR